MGDFAHLHVHTEYSLLDGASKIDALMARARELGQPSMAITDHGTMHGVIEFYRKAKASNIHPILGTEAYRAKRSRFDKDKTKDRKPYHLLLLAKNNKGYDNMMALSSKAQLEGYYYKPRIDLELLEQHNEGIIVTSGCFGADIPQAILSDNTKEALRLIHWYEDVFGEDFYLELQYRKQSSGQNKINQFLIEANKKNYVKAPLIVTSDSHYTYPTQSEMHDTLLCMQTGALKSAPTTGVGSRMAFDEDTYYIVDDKEIAKAFNAVPQALTNTLEIAAKCQVDLTRDEYYLPDFDVPKPHTEDSYLEYLCQIGLEWRYGDRYKDADVQEQLSHELSIISEMGFAKYFLVVWDIVEFARAKDIWFSTRGSACASIASYSLGISSLDPLKLNLYFERFLNPHRVSMPDIDLDFEDTRRSEMFQYLIDRFGNDRVAGILTFNRLGAKSTFRDVARTLGVPLDLVSKAAKHIDAYDTKIPIKQFLGNADFASVINANPVLREVVDVASEIQGRVRQTSTHAAGVIIGDKALYKRVPLNRLKSGAQFEGGITSLVQFDMDTAESIGLLKVDFLGLRNLSIIRGACDLIRERHGVSWTLDEIPYLHNGDIENDALIDAGMEIIARGETGGLFQLEGEGMTATLKKMQPTELEHIIATISLYRPGPIEFIDSFIRRMHGKEKVTYRHPKLEPILASTFGIIVYQEQLMAICSELFGYTPAEADMMRRTVSKKKIKEMEVHKKKIREQAPKYGVDAETAMTIFDDIEYFANYGFNRAHGAIYAAVAVKEAVIKAQYPLEYMAALLSYSEIHNFARYLKDCKHNNIEVLPPNINYSNFVFNVEDGHNLETLRCGLQPIKYVGHDAIQSIIEGRKLFNNNVFPSLRDFLHKVDMTKLGKRAMESLVDVGAFDDFADRHTLRMALPKLLKYSKSLHKRQQKDAAEGQMSLFSNIATLLPEFKLDQFLPIGVEIPKEDDIAILAKELELIGFYISARPIDKYESVFNDTITSSIDELIVGDPDINPQIGSLQRIGGEILDVHNITTKRGKPMGFLTVRDWHDTAGEISITVFPRIWERYNEKFRIGEPVIIVGKLDHAYNRYSIVLDNIDFVAHNKKYTIKETNNKK